MVVCTQQCSMPKKGLTLSEDAYDIGVGKGDEHREVIKQLFNAMVQMKEPQDSPPLKSNSVKLVRHGSSYEDLSWRSMNLSKISSFAAWVISYSMRTVRLLKR